MSAFVSPIDLRGVQDAIFDLVDRSTKLPAIWANEGAPQPPYPFVFLSIVSGPQRIGGRDDKQYSDQPGDLLSIHRYGERQITISIQVIAAPSADSFDVDQNPHANFDPIGYLSAIEMELESRASREAFGLIPMAFNTIAFQAPIAAYTGAQFERRAVADIVFTVLASNERCGITETVENILSAEIDGALDDQGQTINTSITVESTP